MQQTLAVISLGTIVRNALAVQKRARVPLVAVVKDDAYGHGAERVSLALEPHVAAFAVATVSEGAALRVAGVLKEILVLTPCLCEEEVLRCRAYGLTATVSSLASLRLLAPRMRVQIALNTGMNRYGFPPSLYARAAREAEKRGLNVVGVFSHLYAPGDEAARREQISLFARGAALVRERFPAAVRHLAATGGILAGDCAFDAVRCGIALYGYLPGGCGTLPVSPAMKLYASVSGGGMFTGGGAGYARAEREYGKLHTLRIGYGDGLFRTGGIGIGDLCMDACIAEGDLRFGRRKRVLKDISRYAREHGTTEYEVLVRIAAKAEKRYV